MNHKLDNKSKKIFLKNSDRMMQRLVALKSVVDFSLLSMKSYCMAAAWTDVCIGLANADGEGAVSSAQGVTYTNGVNHLDAH